MYHSIINNQCKHLTMNRLDEFNFVDTNTNNTYIHHPNNNFILQIKNNHIVPSNFVFCHCDNKKILYMYIETNRLYIIKEGKENIICYEYVENNLLLNKTIYYIQGDVFQIKKYKEDFYCLSRENSKNNHNNDNNWYITKSNSKKYSYKKNINICDIYENNIEMCVDGKNLYLICEKYEHDYVYGSHRSGITNIYTLNESGDNLNIILSIRKFYPEKILFVDSLIYWADDQKDIFVVKNQEAKGIISLTNKIKLPICIKYPEYEQKENCLNIYDYNFLNKLTVLSRIPKSGIKFVNKFCDSQIILEN